MEAFLVLIFVAVLVYLFGSPLFLLIRLGRQREETARLAREIAVMQGDLERLRRRNREAPQAAEPTLEAGRAQEPDRPGEPGDRPWRNRGAEVSGGGESAAAGGRTARVASATGFSSSPTTRTVSALARCRPTTWPSSGCSTMHGT